jgi:hypothetical protein
LEEMIYIPVRDFGVVWALAIVSMLGGDPR